MRYRLPIILGLLVLCVSMMWAQSAPRITVFTSDRASVTPDEAESGTAYMNLTWNTDGMRPDDTVHLQVYVLGQWHNVQEAGTLANSGAMNWAVPHTLDFIPPSFRLVVRDADGEQVDFADLVIPYTTVVDPDNPPAFMTFSISLTTVTDTQIADPDFVIPVICFQGIHQLAQ